MTADVSSAYQDTDQKILLRNVSAVSRVRGKPIDVALEVTK